MAKATKAVNAPKRAGDNIELKLAAGAVIFEGILVAINSDGNAVAASDTSGLKVVGRAENAADNTSGNAGDLSVVVSRGVFRYNNSSTKALTKANFGDAAFVEDDNTVASESTNSVIAGLVVGIDDVGVWVDTKVASLITLPAADTINDDATE